MSNKRDQLTTGGSSSSNNNYNNNDLPPPYSSNVDYSHGVIVEESIQPYPEVPYRHTPNLSYTPPLPPSTPLYQNYSNGLVNPGYLADTVILSQPVSIKELKDEPTMTTCPHCNAIVLSRVKFEPGSATWLSSLGLFFFGITSCCCCLVPFCINDLKDCIHSCPNCNKAMAKYSRLEGKVYKAIH
ncbi:13743_t:CDS:2 [Entrophospora sp. SA101]|nr:13666_t:CDS:2 [Entrophospora sp. SA101]CAJ0642069.1 5641_t:CDS:2 [Entrophospora sp. SA101]CAJ0649136.1 16160_t:CDS:2 [Entrophospora sp. SA101]CAJ0746736.1 13743_t:CDS:2 [Entrophospora sp. SA101]CAJ0835349.1 2355_t:CDS:2 [Entrophospora sp. SA101]